MRNALWSSLGFVLVVTACSSSDSGANGSAPTIADVTLDKTEVKVGVLDTIKVTINYADADGDVAKVENTVTPQGGSSQAPTSLDIKEAAGQKQGTQAIAIQIGAPQAGTADLAFWLVDAKGNESAHVTKTITAK